MRVMCSVFESQVKGLQESPLKVLQGNQDIPIFQARSRVVSRTFHGRASWLARYANPLLFPYPFSSPLDVMGQFMRRYLTQTDVFGDYVGVSRFDAFNNASSSGYPVTVYFPWPMPGITSDPGPYDAFDYATRNHITNLTETNLSLNNTTGGPALGVSTLSDFIDPAPVFTQALTTLPLNDYLFEDDVNWTKGVQVAYDEGSSLLDGSPGTHTGAQIISHTILGAVPIILSPISPINVTELRNALACVKGWSGGPTGVSVFDGQARILNGSTAQYYWIGHWRSSLGAGGAGVYGKFDFISDGFAGINDVWGRDINLPFPSGMFPLQALSAGGQLDCALMQEFYFFVIGMDPTTFTAKTGVQFRTLLTNGTYV